MIQMLCLTDSYWFSVYLAQQDKIITPEQTIGYYTSHLHYTIFFSYKQVYCMLYWRHCFSTGVMNSTMEAANLTIIWVGCEVLKVKISIPD